MKIIVKLLILLFVLNSGCQPEKEVTRESYNVEINILPKVIYHDAQYYPNGIYSPRGDSRLKVAKLYLINQGEDLILYTHLRYYFKITDTYNSEQKRREKVIDFDADIRDGCRIMLKKNDSVAIYMNYLNITDSLYLNILWKRDSLGKDELTFYKTTQGEIKYHSSKKIGRGKELTHYEKTYDCGFMTKQDRDKELSENPRE